MEVKTNLSESIIIPIRFSEVDPLNIVWHGHYAQYFEDAREAFGKKYQLSYLDLHSQGLIAPIVKLECDYKKMIQYQDIISIEITLWKTLASKLIFTYEIKNVKTSEIVAIGKTIQVYLNLSYELQLTTPDFIQNWKLKHLFDE